jgi:hypothetical protein
MQLSVKDRLLILNLDTLPKVGNILTMRIKQQLINDVGFKEEEIKDLEIKSENNNVTWSPDAPDSEIEIGEQGLKMIVEALDKSENLNENYISLYDKLKALETQ